MVTISIRRFSFRALAVASALAGGSAFADISWNVFTIEATNSQGTATWSGTYDQGSWIAPDVYRWDGGGVSLEDEDGDVIAVLDSGTFIAVEDPIVNLLFHVTAGAADTVFSITSGLLSFPAIVNGEGSASTGMTLTDSGQDNGAILTGIAGPSGARSYEANYNGIAPAGTNFAEFIPGLSTPIPGDGDSDNDGTGGFLPIPGAVTSMSARYAFVISANDSASGTSSFNIRVPEPASVMLVLVASWLSVAVEIGTRSGGSTHTLRRMNMSSYSVSRDSSRARKIVTAIGSMAAASLAQATLPTVVFRAEAISVAGDGVVEVSFDQGEFDPGSGTYHYSQSGNVDVISEATGEIVATITGVELYLETGGTNSIELSFGVLAGRAATTFVIDSPIIRHRSVPANEARGRASAWITITDLDNNYAMLQGIGPAGTGAFTGNYNIDGDGEGTQFSNLVGFLYAGQGATVSGGQLDPPTGYRSISEVVHSSQTVVAFTVTPNDEVSATTVMTVPGRSQECVGDADADWDIDLADLAALLRGFGTTGADPEYSLDADLDLNGAVDLGDLTTLLSVFGTTCE